MFGSVELLEKAIKELVVIPKGLENNISFNTPGLGGIFISYRSDCRGGAASLNSTVQFTILIDTTDGAGNYEGDDVGLTMTLAINIKPMRSIRKKMPYDYIAGKVNVWLEANKDYLINSIKQESLLDIVESEDITPHRRKKKSNVSKAVKKSNHKHEYRKCLLKVTNDVNGKQLDSLYLGRICNVCERIRIDSYFVTRRTSEGTYLVLNYDEILAKYTNLEVIPFEE